MKTTYSITEAQARFPALVKEAQETPITITRHNDTVGYFVSVERMEAILETLELLAHPQAMEAVREYERGSGDFRRLEELDAEE